MNTPFYQTRTSKKDGHKEIFTDNGWSRTGTPKINKFISAEAVEHLNKTMSKLSELWNYAVEFAKE